MRYVVVVGISMISLQLDESDSGYEDDCWLERDFYEDTPIPM
jgi:hypothetical protein